MVGPERIGHARFQGLSLVPFSKSLLSFVRSFFPWRRTWLGRGRFDRTERGQPEPLVRNNCPVRSLATDLGFRRLLENLPRVAVQGYDKHRRVVYWNQASEALYGFRAGEAVGRNLEDLLIPEAMRDEVIEAHRAWIEEGICIPAGPLVLKDKSGSSIAVYSHHIMLGTEDDEPLMFCIDVDQQALHTVQKEFALIENVDTLTRLPGQRRFEAELSMAMHGYGAKQGGLAVLAIDIESGSAASDMADTTMAAAVGHCLELEEGTGRLAYYGRNRFVMFIPDTHEDSEVLDRVEGIFRRLGKADALRDQAVSASIGICLFPGHDASATALVQRAGMAARRARRAGPNRYWFFDQRLYAALHRQHHLMQDLRRSLDDGEFILRYQSYAMSAKGQGPGLEAKLQWAPRNGEVLSPFGALPADEKSSLLMRLGDWVLLDTCLKRAGRTLEESDTAEVRAALDELIRQCEVEQAPAALRAFDTEPGSALIEAVKEGKQYAIRLEAEPLCQQVVR